MNIFVCVKQIPDIRSNITPNSRGDYIDTENLRWDINPEDECAVEEALLIRKQFPESTITAIRTGDKRKFEALVTAIAMGADDAILVRISEARLDPYMTALALKGAIDKSGKQADLILCGTEASGDESAQVPQLLAQLLNCTCVTRVTKCHISRDKMRLERRVEGGVTEVYRFRLPAVIACYYGINKPRYAPYPHILAAREKPLTEFTMNDLGHAEPEGYLRYSKLRRAPERKTDKLFHAIRDDQIEGVAEKIVASLISSELPGYNAEQ